MRKIFTGDFQTMDCYSIAGLSVRMSCRGEPLASRAAKYRCPELSDADMTIAVTECELDEEARRTPQFSRGECEYMLTSLAFYNELLSHGGMLLHAAAVSVDGYAYLFSAQSGVGKSTHAALYESRFGPRAFVINGDKPALILRDGRFFACGTPWSGKEDASRNTAVPVRAIAFLSRGESNAVRRMSPSEALVPLIEQTLRPREPKKIEELLSLADKLLMSVPVFSASVNMEASAAKATFEAMSRGDIL